MNAEIPLVSILVLNWNGEKLLEDCISSVLNTHYSNYEIIIVDNASTDNSVAIINKYPSIRLIPNLENLGFAAGNNVGFAVARGKYIVTLNNDVEVDPDWLQKPVEQLEKDTSIGIVSCRQMDYYDRDVINGLFHYPDSALLFRSFGFGEKLNMDHLRSGFVISANGASSIFRKEMLDRIGGFDDRFFAYHKDCDIGMRAFLAGWKCLYVPDAVIYHKEGSSFKKRSNTFNYYFTTCNRFWLLYKHFPVSFLLRHFIPILIWEMRVARIKILKERIGKQHFRAITDCLKRLGKFKAERRRTPFFFVRKGVNLFNSFANELWLDRA